MRKETKRETQSETRPEITIETKLEMNSVMRKETKRETQSETRTEITIDTKNGTMMDLGESKKYGPFLFLTEMKFAIPSGMQPGTKRETKNVTRTEMKSEMHSEMRNEIRNAMLHGIHYEMRDETLFGTGDTTRTGILNEGILNEMHDTDRRAAWP
jgi:hypothetical protein